MRSVRWYVLSAAGAVILVVMLGNSNERSELNASGGAEVHPVYNLAGNKMAEKSNRIQGNGSAVPTSGLLPITNFKGVSAKSKQVIEVTAINSIMKETDPQALLNVNEYIKLLEKKVDKKKTIIISTVDYSFVDMAINFYKTSVERWGLTNYLFLCSHARAKERLSDHGIDAVQLWNDTNGTRPSDFATLAFNRKTKYKTMAATLALDLGYSVLVVDVDIVFFKNPIPFLTCDNCELIIQSEGSEYYRNTGFYFAIPTKNVIKLHHMVLNTFKSMAVINDQQALNGVLLHLESQTNFKVKVLDLKLFPNGNYYFDKGQRMFADDNPCTDCVLVHNNFIASYSNKKYRFREHLLWSLDEDQYYSNPKAKYLMYENSFDFGAKYTWEMEEKALKTAFTLGNILKRIVILPKFYCHKCPMDICSKNHPFPRCAAYVHYNMTIMDHVLKNKYRENMFLRNKLVPTCIKRSFSPKIFIKSKTTNQQHISSHLDMKDVSKIFTPSNLETGATQKEFLDWLKPFEKFSVLNFHSLYGQIISSENIVDISYIINIGIKSFYQK